MSISPRSLTDIDAPSIVIAKSASFTAGAILSEWAYSLDAQGIRENEASDPIYPPGVPMTPDESWRLDPTPDAPSKARDWIYQALQIWDVDDSDGVADVLTSELVTNAVRYAGSRQLVLRLAWELGRLRVEVEDDGAGSVDVKPADPNRGDGYGLLMVQQLADRWGWEPTSGGKSVWFELLLDDSRNA
jgi:anti-sigma regulatory factor (Ser/Thr protein kinase)